MAHSNDASRGPRDKLDRLIAGNVRAARQPRGLPTPQRGEPSDDELLRYVEGTSPGDEKARVAAAMKQSPFTRDRVELLRESLAEAGLAPSAVTRAARYVFVMAKDALELLRGTTAPLMGGTPALATRHGGDVAAAPRAGQCWFEFTQPFDDLDAHLKIEHVTRANAAPSIDVQIKLIAAGTPAKDARVTLLRAGRTIDSVPVEENGAATFSGLEQDRYELDVRRAGKSVGKVHLDFV